MPIGRYIIWVGTSLLALLFVADWFVPKSNLELSHGSFEVPPIQITSQQRLPESVFIDTNQPTIIPTPILSEDTIENAPLPLNSYASAESPAVESRADQKAPKNWKPHKKVFAAPKSTPVRTHVVSANVPAAVVQPTRLSLPDIVSVMSRRLFNSP
jgi:hypothetical protein